MGYTTPCLQPAVAGFLLLMLGYMSQITTAADITWTASGSGYWQDNDNWDVDRVPEITDSVIIESGTYSHA